MLGSLAGNDPPDTVASSELIEHTGRKVSNIKLKLRTATFLTAGWAIISEVSEGVLSTDIGKKLRTPGGSPAWSQNQRDLYRLGDHTDIMQSVCEEGGGVWAEFRGADHDRVATNKWKRHRYDHK